MLPFTTKPVRMASFAAVFSAMAGAALASPAPVSPLDEEPQHLTVRFADLNPSSDRDMRTLYIRLRQAAQAVCGDDDEISDLIEYREINRCEQQALEDAVAQINQPLLTAMYDRHYPDAPMVSRVNAPVPRA